MGRLLAVVSFMAAGGKKRGRYTNKGLFGQGGRGGEGWWDEAKGG